MLTGNSRRRAVRTADEQDVHTGWRKVLKGYGQAGRAAKVKRATNKRERREARQELKRTNR